MEHRPAGHEDEVPERLLMCSHLYIAAFEGRTQEVNRLLTSSRGATTAVDNGRSFSASQAKAGHHGPCSTSEVTAERSTLLHIAAGEGHCGLIAELCRRDIGLLSLVNSALDTPLHSAARAGRADAVEAIVRLAREANVEEDALRGAVRGENEAGDTALHLVARHGHGEAVERLMATVPELASSVNSAGASPLYLAVVSASLRAVRAIVWYGDADGASSAGPGSQNALHAAVLQSSEMVSLLLQWKPSLATEVDSNRSSPLHFAASDGDCRIVEVMVRHAPPRAAYLQDEDGRSALHAAALMGHAAAVRLLLRFYPATADARDHDGRSFLHSAAMRGRSSVVSYALKNRMLERLLNAQDREGNTPLHLAVLAGEYGIVRKLLSSGIVQLHIMNNAGHTPADLAENSSGFFSMVRLVVKLSVYGAQFQPRRQDHIEKWNGQDVMKWREDTSKNLAVISTLVATVAFSAAFNVPGSYGPDGRANLRGERLFSAFLVLDTIAVTTSVMATILLVYGRASRSHRSWLCFMIAMHFLWLSLNSMMLGFFSAVAAVIGQRKPMKIALSQLMYYGLYVLNMVLTSLATPGSLAGVVRFLAAGSCSERRRRAKRRVGRQFPFVMYYAVNVVVFIVVNSIAISAVDVTGRVF